MLSCPLDFTLQYNNKYVKLNVVGINQFFQVLLKETLYIKIFKVTILLNKK